MDQRFFIGREVHINIPLTMPQLWVDHELNSVRDPAVKLGSEGKLGFRLPFASGASIVSGDTSGGDLLL